MCTFHVWVQEHIRATSKDFSPTCFGVHMDIYRDDVHSHIEEQGRPIAELKGVM